MKDLTPQLVPRGNEPEMSRPGRSLRPRLSQNVIWVGALLLFLLLSAIVVTIFNSEIRDNKSTVQADYIVDAYYYIYLGRQAADDAVRDGRSLYSAAEALAPNSTSTGVVFLSASLLQVIRWEVLIPGALALILFVPIIMLYRTGGASVGLIGLPFCGLFPYLAVPSKEVFLIAGLGLIAVVVTARRYLFLGTIGLAMMFLGRPEAFYIFVACVGAWAMFRTRVGMVVFVISATGGYLIFAREAAYAVSLLHQSLMDQAGLGFCTVGPLNVCVEDINSLEWRYVARLISLTPLPLKWVGDAAATLYNAPLLMSEAIIRWANFSHLIWLYLVIRHSRPVTGRTLALRQILISFAVVYWFVYGSILFFQPSRQAVLATTFLGLALVLRDRSMVMRKVTRLTVSKFSLHAAPSQAGKSGNPSELAQRA
jgi:hypothetical protein